MTNLPPGWAQATLEDLLAPEPRAMTDGPFGSNLTSSHYTDRGARVIRLQNIGDGKFRDERAYISLDHFERLRSHEVRAGDLVVASLGDDLPRACIVPDLREPAIVKADCIRVRPHPMVETKWLLYALIAPQTRDCASAKIRGVGRPRLGMNVIRRIPIPVPPVAEQRRIVTALDAHLSRLDAAERVTTSAAGRARKLHDAVLASEVESVRAAVTCELGSLLREPLRNGHSARVSTDGQGIRAVTLTAVTRDDFSNKNTKVTSASPARVRDLWLTAGDILIQRSNTPELVGTAALYSGPPNWAVFPDLLIRVRVDVRVLPEYLLLILRASSTREFLRSAARGLAGSMPKIDQATILQIKVPLPSISEQKALVARVNNCNDLTSRMAGAVEHTSQRARHLRQSLLAAAFGGRLVPQDPEAEPASAMLERIRKERDAQPKPQRRRRAASASQEEALL